MQIFTVFLVLALANSAWCYTGRLKYTSDWKGKLGSCRIARAKTDHFYVARLSKSFMKLPPGIAKPENHPLCNPDRCIEIDGAFENRKIVLKISDTCESCTDYDFEVADTTSIMYGDIGFERYVVNWRFVNCRNNPPGFKTSDYKFL